MSFFSSFFYLNPLRCLSLLPQHISKFVLNSFAVPRVAADTPPLCVEVWQTDSGVVSLHGSHYLKSSALKQKVRDQQILTSGRAYDSILMQFSLSNSLIITLSPANLISHLSKFRHIHSTSIFTRLWH